MKVGDLVIEKRLCMQPFHCRISMITEIFDTDYKPKIMVQNLRTRSEYWLYLDTVEAL
jgi:hypothetical protein